MQAELRYNPEGITAVYEHTAEQETYIRDHAINLRIDLPKRIVSGQKIDIEVHYSSVTNTVFNELELRLDYPSEFHFSQGLPVPDVGKNIWKIGILPAREAGNIVIRGDIDTPEGSFPTLKATIFAPHPTSHEPVLLGEAQRGIEPQGAPLTVSLTAQDSESPTVNFGEKISYRIDYINTTDIMIPEVVIKAVLEGDIFDLKTISSPAGSVVMPGNEIVWNAATAPELGMLEAGETGKLNFTVDLDKLPVIRTQKDKNFTIKATASIESLKVPIELHDVPIKSESALVIPLKSLISFDAQGMHRDSDIANSGPIPPKVGEVTTYTISWMITNYSNDLKNVRVSAALPPHIRWQDKIVPDSAPITYNPLTGEVIWNIGDMPAHTGILRPAEKVSFQISFTPTAAHIGRLPELISESHFEALDNFTGMECNIEDGSILTDLPDDPAIGWIEGTVVR